MTGNIKTLVIGLAVLLALGGALLMLTLWPEAEPEATPAPPSAEPIPPLADETYLTVTHITVTLDSGESYEISPVPGDTVDYKMNTPAGVFPWDMSRVRETGAAALRVAVDEIAEENAGSERLQVYGLDKPASRVKLTRTDGTAAELLIGRQSPTGTHHYAMRAGTGTVGLIRVHVAERLTRAPDDMRDYTLFKTYRVTDEDGQTRIDDFTGHFSRLTLENREGLRYEIGRYLEGESAPPGIVRINRYYLHRPFEAEGHDYAITNGVLDPLLTLRAARVYDKSPADWSVYGLDAPHILTLRDEEGWELELHVGGVNTDEEAGRFLRVAGTDYVLLSADGGDFSFLSRDPFYLRATTAWSRFYDITGVDEIVYEYDGNLRVQSVSAPKPDEPDEPFVSVLDGVPLAEYNGRRLYRRLAEISLDGPYTDPLPDAPPDARFTLRMKDGTARTLSLYSVSGGRHYAIALDGESQMAYTAAGKLQRVIEGLEIVDAGGELPD
ncbi:MAG: DUF4340 domain-containing protein [Oscillospiraceae bacterium]|nr:DUF4340 domain-containing protein [Oscillospiraceae bacterium]